MFKFMNKLTITNPITVEFCKEIGNLYFLTSLFLLSFLSLFFQKVVKNVFSFQDQPSITTKVETNP